MVQRHKKIRTSTGEIDQRGGGERKIGVAVMGSRGKRVVVERNNLKNPLGIVNSCRKPASRKRVKRRPFCKKT